MPFNQMMTLAADLTLRQTDAGLRLCVQPVPELAGLHGEAVALADTTVLPGQTAIAGVDAEALHLRAEFAVGEAAAFGLVVRGVGVTYDPRSERLECNGHSAPLKPSAGKISLEIVADRTSLEVYANDGAAYLPIGVVLAPDRRDLMLVSRDAPTRLLSLKAWPLASIW